ncbi:hypothetical protein [Streptomyces yangpuensis]|uniref:hypothetical protein n=1 Tax=Streptomyces yangpuensis TaxID=1648182 RepID=UPI0006293843|nr:hypothetical protein [Streptomyces yangpuensis]
MTATADFRFAHPGPVADWTPELFDGYLAAQDADRQAAERTLARRALRTGLAAVEVVLAAYACLAVLVLAGLNRIGDAVDWAADRLCTGTDRTTARLARLGRTRPNRLLVTFYDPEQPGRLLPHEDPGEDDAARWFAHWETEVVYSEAAEARAERAEERLAGAEAALALLYVAANLGAVRAEQRAQFMTGTVRSGKSLPFTPPASTPAAGSTTRKEITP